MLSIKSFLQKINYKQNYTTYNELVKLIGLNIELG
jgi:hypothetical protein